MNTLTDENNQYQCQCGGKTWVLWWNGIKCDQCEQIYDTPIFGMYVEQFEAMLERTKHESIKE